MGKQKKSNSSPANKEEGGIKRSTMASNQYSPTFANQISGQISRQNICTVPQNYIQPSMFSYQGNMANAGSFISSPVAGQNVGHVQHTPVSNRSQVNFDPFTLILQLLDSVDSRLSQLYTIQSTMKAMTGRLNAIDEKLKTLDTRVTEVESSRGFDSASMEEIQSKQREIDKLTERLQSLETDKSSCDELMLKLICDELKNNLMFF
jgi:chromosome segregation ATPase